MEAVGADPDKDALQIFVLLPAGALTAAANKRKMEEKGSFVGGFLIWRAR